MAKQKRLSEKDIDQLLGHYRSERRRLAFQLETVRTAIIDLKKAKNALPATRSEGAAKKGPGRPRKNAAAPVAKRAKRSKRGPGRPPKPKRKPRELNAWDNLVLNTIRTTGRLLPKEDLLAAATKWAASKEPGMKAPEVEAHLTRTLQKLSGRKKMLGMHHTGLRRGNHYGLKEWFFSRSGKLRRQHFDRLVLTKD
jgi:hypothetical protein